MHILRSKQLQFRLLDIFLRNILKFQILDDRVAGVDHHRTIKIGLKLIGDQREVGTAKDHGFGFGSSFPGNKRKLKKPLFPPFRFSVGEKQSHTVSENIFIYF